MKRQNYLKGHLPWQSEFDHRFACWAKMKKANKRLAKRREKRIWKEAAAFGADDVGKA